VSKSTKTNECCNCDNSPTFIDYTLYTQCYVKWKAKGKLRCLVCGLPVVDLKRHLSLNEDDRHLVFEIMTS
jgi:hypothetical protein